MGLLPQLKVRAPIQSLLGKNFAHVRNTHVRTYTHAS